MPTQVQTVQVQLGIIIFFIELAIDTPSLKFPSVSIQAQIEGVPDSLTSNQYFDCQSSNLFELRYNSKVFASGVLKYLIQGSQGTGIYAELAIGEPGDQEFYNDLLLSISPDYVPVDTLVPSSPLPSDLPDKTKRIIDRGVRIENSSFTDLFHFVGLKMPSSLPVAQTPYFFSLETNSTFYEKLLQAVKKKSPLASIATEFLAQSCNLEIIQEVLAQDLFALIEQFELLKKQLKCDGEANSSINLIGFPGLSGIQSLEIAFLAPLVITLKDSLNAIMIIKFSPPSEAQTVPSIPATTLEFEKLLLLLRLISYSLRLSSDDGIVPARAALNALAVLPQVIYQDLLSPAKAEATSPSKGSLSPLGIGELMILRQRLKGYALGEIAMIENVMAGEKKTRIRKDKQVEKSIEEEEELKTKEQSDQSNLQNNYNIAQEIAALTSQDQKSFQFAAPPPSGGSLAAAPTTPKGLVKNFTTDAETLSGGWTLAFNPSHNSQDQAFQFVRNLTAKATSRLLSKSRKRHSRILEKEQSKIDQHIFDNRNGDKALIGLYRWVNQVNLGKLISLGQRLLVQFEIPNPATGIQGLDGFHLESGPPELAILKNADYGDLREETYLQYAHLLGIEDLILPPEPTQNVNGIVHSINGDSQITLEVPQKYTPKTLSLAYLFDGTLFSALVGDQILSPSNSSLTTPPTPPPPLPLPKVPSLYPKAIHSGNLSTSKVTHLTGSIPVSILTDGSHFSVNLVLECDLTPIALKTWQIKAWNQLVQAVEEKEKAHLDAKPNGIDAQVNQEKWDLIRSTLQEKALEILRSTLMKADGTDLPPVGDDTLKQAFLWKEMSIQYLSSTSATPNWRDLLTSGYEEDQFDQFLKAPFARIVVALKHRSELTALYTIWSGGKIWDGLPLDVPVLEDHLFYADQLHFDSDNPLHPRTVKEFTMTSPTDMMMLQEDAVLPSLVFPNDSVLVSQPFQSPAP